MTDNIKRGDLLPPWQATLTDAGAPIDLTTASSVKVLFLKPGDSVATSRAATSADAAGVVKMDWLPGDTDVVGDLVAEVEVTWPGSKPQTFPPGDYLVTRIYQDMG
ncbi:hypothetical protein [Nocardioides mesophilus]|uniref:Uncharacterized protein n=1 Tax=Nocardioides mesophilus TaxID=433659 RepID=A0A7G9RA65_9ACTN|nr:hypothetical protein [Nocardioides mesophilus]QNN52490.1 hypothetical protein H9L09_18780 [Nocardioides mesophilus]